MNFSRFFHIPLLFFLFQLLPTKGITQHLLRGNEYFANPLVSSIPIFNPNEPLGFERFESLGQEKLIITSNERAWLFDGRNIEPVTIYGKPKICSSSNGVVFIAGDREIKMLTALSNGLVKTETILSNTGLPDDRYVTDIAVDGKNQIFFSTSNILWKLAGGISPIDSAKGKITLYTSADKFFYHKPNQGIFSLDIGGNAPEFIASNEFISTKAPVAVFQANGYEIIVTSSFPWIFQVKNQKLFPLGDIVKQLQWQKTQVKTAFYRNNEIMVVTDLEGVLILNESGQLKNWIKNRAHPSIELINDIIVNTPNCFLTLTNNAVHRFIRPEIGGSYSWSNGIPSAPTDIAITQNALYISGNDGVRYCRIDNEKPYLLNFVKISGIDERISRLYALNQSVIAIGEDIYRIINGKAERYSSSGINEGKELKQKLLDLGFAANEVEKVLASPNQKRKATNNSFSDHLISFAQSDSLIAIVRYYLTDQNLRTFWLGQGDSESYSFTQYLGVIPPTETPIDADIAPDSTIWLATSTGLIYYTTAKKCCNKPRPAISIFSVGYQSDTSKVFIRKGYFSESESSAGIKYRSPLRHLTINLSSMGLSEWSKNSEGILFATYIDGLDKDWTPWTQNHIREVNISRYGEYNIKAKAIDLQGNESDEASVSFYVQPRFYETRFAVIAGIVLFLLGVYMLFRWRAYMHAKVRFKLESLINQRTEELVKEKEKTENLLARVLPHDTASELKEKGKVNTQRFKMVTVLFSDIEGFTRITDETNPETLIDQLDKFFLYFDSVVEKYKIEKIKTIGDAYMCAGGIPEKNRTNPVEVILAALEMMLYMKSITSSSSARSKVWELRIGVDTGPVIAGVVGRSKLTYDIWGSTVNTASRMESSGEAGQINISGNTFMLVKDYFICTFRGKMPVKNKGDIQMYFVNGIKPSLSEGMQGLKPNQDFFILLQLIRLGDLEDLILEKLEKGLPKNLYYHNLKHTVDVYTQVELIGRSENVSKEEMLMLRTAALFHDAGHLIDYDTHEEMAVKLAKEILPEYQYTERQIETISQLIMATKMPPTPKNLLEEIMCDADLDYLGRPDFLPVSNTLYRELHEHGKIGTLAEWNELQIKFIDKHFYFTKTARRLRNVNKQSQLDKLKLWMENN